MSYPHMVASYMNRCKQRASSCVEAHITEFTDQDIAVVDEEEGRLERILKKKDADERAERWTEAEREGRLFEETEPLEPNPAAPSTAGQDNENMGEGILL